MRWRRQHGAELILDSGERGEWQGDGVIPRFADLASRPTREYGREKIVGNLRVYIETPEILSAVRCRLAESWVEAVSPPTGLSSAVHLMPGNERLERASERSMPKRDQRNDATALARVIR